MPSSDNPSGLLSVPQLSVEPLLDSLTEGVLVRSGPTILYTNAAFGAVLGYARSELAGRRALDLVCADDRSSAREHLETAAPAQLIGCARTGS